MRDEIGRFRSAFYTSAFILTEYTYEQSCDFQPLINAPVGHTYHPHIVAVGFLFLRWVINIFVFYSLFASSWYQFILL